ESAAVGANAVNDRTTAPPEIDAASVKFAPPSGPSRMAPAASRHVTIATVVIVIWLAGAVFFVLRALVGLTILYSYRCRAVLLSAEDRLQCLEALTDHQQIPANVELRETALIESPLTLGWLRPTILLPIAWRTWTDRQRAMILSHELAHIRRRDFLTAVF